MKFDVRLSQFNLASRVPPVCRERKLEHRVASFAVFRLFIDGEIGPHNARMSFASRAGDESPLKASMIS
jgi:hypothetical protein